MIRPYSLPDSTCRQAGNRHFRWVKSVCPVCGSEFEHTSDSNPPTCGRYECLRKAFRVRQEMTV
jgi:hypothetical protein